MRLIEDGVRGVARGAWLSGVIVLAVACSSEVETKKPAIEQPSASAVPPPVDPELVCAAQHASRVTLHGEHFVATPIDLPGKPKAAMPTVTLSRTHELDGDDVASPDQVVYSGDHDADPTNALDGSGELILVDGQPLLTWTSQQEMSVLVTQDLVLGPKPEGDDNRARGMLEPGVWDVRVENRSGDAAESLGTLAVVDKPELESVTPGIVCLAQGPRTLTLAGQSLLRNGNQQVQLAVTGAETPFAVELSDCTAIAHVGIDAEVCASATVQLAQNSIPVGYPGLRLENPETAACHSEEEVSLRVVPPPRITAVVEALACVAQGGRSFDIEGADFLRVDGTITPKVTVGDTEIAVTSMECDAPLAAGEHMVELCSSMTIEVTPGELEPGLYDVRVVNPDDLDAPESGCSNMATDALRIVAPPTIDGVEPAYVCLEDGSREVVVHGSDFLSVDGQNPSVELNGTALAAAAVDVAGCDAAAFDVGGLNVQRCDRLVLTLADGDVELGNPSLQVENPAPAGCSAEATDLWTVLPRPTLEDATPLLVCNAQGDVVLTLTGTGFLALDGDAPTVMVGSVTASSVEVTSDSCEPIDGRDDGQLCTELIVTLAEGSLAEGVHDVVVVNTDPSGCTTQESVELVAVDPPEVASVTPNPVCVEEDIEVTITGSHFVRIGDEQPSVTIGEVSATDVAVIDATCEPIEGTDDAEACTELTATIAMGALDVDSTNRVTVTNPGTLDGCESEEEVDLDVVPPPTITSLDSANVCTGGGTVAITGTGLAGISARLVDPDTGGVIDALNTVVDTGGTQATITFGSGVQPDTYELVIANPSGCGDTAAQDVVAIAGPVAFFVDPPVAYNGVSLRATVYVSGVSTAPAGVILTPEGGGTVADQEPLDDIAWPSSGSNNKVGATIPAGLDEGVYDVMVDFASGCDAVLAAGVTIEADATIALLEPALHPQFGEQSTEVAVNVFAEATADLAAGEVNFQPTPRAYLSGSSLIAEPLRAVAFDTEERLTAIVPDTLPAGLYDLVVVNPDGSVGFQAGAYEATVVAPPVIDDVTPTQLDNDIDRPITITGTNFVNPSTDIEVELDCLSPGATTPTTIGPLALDPGSTDISLVATVPDGITHGSICVVRVTNTSNDTYDEFSALTVTNPASKLPAFKVGTALIEGRRAPAGALGDATREARFVYAIGGDDGDSANALTSVEAAPIGRFGDLGAWRTLATELPEGVTQAQAASGGRFIYLLGGLVDNLTSAAIRRAVVLDPNEAPEVTDVDLRFFGGTVDSDPTTREGLAPGAWTYVISAVFAPGDEENPGGESLRSEPVTVYAPDVPDGVEIQLDWGAVFGFDDVTEAVTYRIYRTTAPDSPIASLRLLAEVTAPTHTYTDQNPATFEDADKAPLAVGDLGEWRTLPDELNSARAAYGIGLANDPDCDPFLYLVGGRTDAATESASYEYASFDPVTGDLGAFTEATGSGLTARRELAAFVADDQSSAEIEPAPGVCESYLYASYGQSGASTIVNTVQEAAVSVGGALGAFTNSGPSGSAARAGHAAFFSSDGAYLLGGRTSSSAAIDDAVQAVMCTGASCDAPDLGNFSSASNNLEEPRYLPGFARQGAFFYLIGGADENGDALASTESNVR